MNAQAAYDIIAADGLLAGMRGDFPPDKAVKIAEVCIEEGIRTFELTMNSPQAIEAMQAIKAEFGADACSGMGTVLDVETAKRVLDASPDFVVSPAFTPAVVEVVVKADILMAPGVITPTECVNAWAMGVKMLKIFPIGPMGVDYFKSVRGPLDHMKFMANGGINPETTRDFMKAGAIACGAANWLTGDGSWSLDKIRERAKMLRDAVEEVRSGKVVQRV
jgi:2-dehydro-3-deoxyphosphogluconate aldolase/(4S)-4-hydroxy-2-oxoglutarate aldolase